MRGIINIVIGLIFIVGGLSGGLVCAAPAAVWAWPSWESSSPDWGFFDSPIADEGPCQGTP